MTYLVVALLIATIALAFRDRRTSSRLARETSTRQALEAHVNTLGSRIGALERREASGGPLSSQRPLMPTPASQSGVRPRATIGAPPEDETQVMQRGTG